MSSHLLSSMQVMKQTKPKSNKKKNKKNKNTNENKKKPSATWAASVIAIQSLDSQNDNFVLSDDQHEVEVITTVHTEDEKTVRALIPVTESAEFVRGTKAMNASKEQEPIEFPKQIVVKRQLALEDAKVGPRFMRQFGGCSTASRSSYSDFRSISLLALSLRPHPVPSSRSPYRNFLCVSSGPPRA